MYFISFITYGSDTEQNFMENGNTKIFNTMEDCAKVFAQLEECGHTPKINLCRID